MVPKSPAKRNKLLRSLLDYHLQTRLPVVFPLAHPKYPSAKETLFLSMFNAPSIHLPPFQPSFLLSTILSLPILLPAHPLRHLPQLPLQLLHPPEETQIKRHSLPQPHCSLRVIPLIIASVKVHEYAERTTMDHQPRNKGAELGGREDVHLEHGHCVRADGLRVEAVGAEFGD